MFLWSLIFQKFHQRIATPYLIREIFLQLFQEKHMENFSILEIFRLKFGKSGLRGEMKKKYDFHLQFPLKKDHLYSIQEYPKYCSGDYSE